MPDLLPPAGYQLLFSDEFPGSSLDTTKWRAEDNGTSDPSRVTVSGGQLILRATGTSHSPDDRLTAGVRSSDTDHLGTWKGYKGLYRMLPAPGWLDIRMQASEIRGVMSEIVIWTDFFSPSGLSWADTMYYGEMDLIELVGRTPTLARFDSHAWTRLANDSRPDNAGPNSTLDIAAGASHQWVAHWDYNFVHFYVDGVLGHVRDMSDDPYSGGIFGYPTTIAMNCFIFEADNPFGIDWAALAAGEGGGPGARMAVDYVRFYTRGRDDGSAIL